MTGSGVGEARHTHLCYDEAGDLRSITRPREAPIAVTCGTDGAAAGTQFTERREYTGAHEPHKSISPGGNVTTHTYDPDGNLAETTDPEGAKVTRSYDGRGLLVEAVEDFETGASPRRLTTRMAYDAVGNPRHFYSPRAIEAAGGSPTPASDFVKTTEYDGLDRPVRELLPRTSSEDRRYVHRRFDAVGNLTRITVPVLEGNLDTILASAEQTRKWVTSYTHFDPGWIRTSEDLNGLVQFDYSPEGWQTERMPARSGKDTSRDYYRDGLLRSFRDEGANLLLRRYDLNGNLTFLSDDGVSSTRKPITLDIDHNGFDQIASSTAREENRHTKVTTYTYWLDGLVRTRADDREEDGSGGLVRAARRHEFQYDPDGRLSVHMDLGRDAGAGDDKRTTHSYFPTGRERERVVAHWAGGAFQPRQTTRREYFANGLLRTLRTWGGAGEVSPLRESHTLAYRDPGGVYVGHVTSDEFFRASPQPGAPCSTSGDECTQQFVYDGGDRLVEEYDGHDRRTRYKLTPAGGIEEKRDADTNELQFLAHFDGTRMVKRTLDPDGANPNTVLLHYDGEGNLDCTTEPGGTRDDCSRSGGEVSPLVVEDFSYDYRNRLTSWERPEANRSTVYEHDALDRPIRETETVGASTTIHALSYVGATRLLADEQETGARQKTRSYSHDAYGRLTGMSYKAGPGSPTHELSYAYDPRGSVSLLLDDSGQPKAAYGYTGYGEPDPGLTAERLPDTGQPPGDHEQVNPFRYSAKRSDALSGTIDMGARQFGPSLGQFLQADRYDSALADLGLASDPLTGNRYALAAGNPISYVEVDGHDPHANDTQSRGGCFDCGPGPTTRETLAGHANALHQATSGSTTTGGGSSAGFRPQPSTGSAPLTDVSSDPNNYPGTQPPTPTGVRTEYIPRNPYAAGLDTSDRTIDLTGAALAVRDVAGGFAREFTLGAVDFGAREGVAAGIGAGFAIANPKGVVQRLAREGGERAVNLAANGAPAIVRGGETAAARYGREIHKTFDYGRGFRREFSLPSGRRADAVSLRTRAVIELKPNNPRAIALGRRQLEEYARELEELYPGTPFTRRLETYDRP